MQTFYAHNWKLVAITHGLMLLQNGVERKNLAGICESTPENE